MVKIRELSDTQLVSQIQKYERIYFQLVNERDKRVESQGKSKALYTPRELELNIVDTAQEEEEEDSSPSNETKSYQLKFDESEIDQINEAEKSVELQKETPEDEVRVTQLLRLSKEQLDELRGNKKVKKVTKKVKKKVRK